MKATGRRNGALFLWCVLNCPVLFTIFVIFKSGHLTPIYDGPVLVLFTWRNYLVYRHFEKHRPKSMARGILLAAAFGLAFSILWGLLTFLTINGIQKRPLYGYIPDSFMGLLLAPFTEPFLFVIAFWVQSDLWREEPRTVKCMQTARSVVESAPAFFARVAKFLGVATRHIAKQVFVRLPSALFRESFALAAELGNALWQFPTECARYLASMDIREAGYVALIFLLSSPGYILAAAAATEHVRTPRLLDNAILSATFLSLFAGFMSVPLALLIVVLGWITPNGRRGRLLALLIWLGGGPLWFYMASHSGIIGWIR